MKPLLLLLCSLFSGLLMAQDCRDHLLMQKGVQLEYQEYWPKPDSTRAGRAVSRLVFEVDHTTDSAGSTWSSITKRGISIFDPNDRYERKIVLQCDGKSLHLPYDLYFADTIYMRDFYPDAHGYKYKYILAYTPLVDAISYIIPLELDCVLSLPEGKKYFEQAVKQQYWLLIPFKSNPVNYDQINIKSIVFAGKESVTTPAGTFPCYKYCVDDGSDSKPYSWLYFNRNLGLIKFEDWRTCVVLTGIKK